MLHMHHAMTHTVEATPAMIRGTMMHMALLEPERFDKLITFDCTRAAKEYKELLKDHDEDELIKLSERDDYLKAAEVAANHPAIKHYALVGDGEAEKVYTWDGLYGPAKAKLDYVKKDLFIEYKTTQNIDSFDRVFRSLRYDIGLGWYWHATGGLPAIMIVQEQNEPYDVAVYEFGRYVYESWYNQCLEIWSRYESGDRSGRYNGLILLECEDRENNLIELEE